jgi:predicted ATPase
MADTLAPSDDPLLGAVVDGKYRLDARLGEGGMGVVYRATQLALQREVAVKVLTHSAHLRADMQERFRREALAIARLNHPNIVTIHDFGSVPRFGPYFVMELLEGPTLAAEIERRGPLPVDLALRLAADMCAAVAYAHGASIIHRDLKPGNVVLSGDDDATLRAKVLDFGLAWFRGDDAESRVTASDAILGTPQYMAPEQSEGSSVDERADVYALGCILHEILTGEPPFRARTPIAVLYKHVTEPAPPPSRTAPHVAADLDAVVLRALAKDPCDRYATVEEMAEALAALRGSGDASRTTDPGPLAAGRVSPNNLPHELTSFVGREHEVAEILRDVADRRLVTLTGPGGIGKTRFALRVAARLLADGADGAAADGIWFVDLSPLTDPALVAQAIAETLGVQEPRDGDVAQALRDDLASKRALIVLDNCEHVVAAAAALVGSLLARCPALRILATSRELLGVPGEVVRPVPPLEVPNADAPSQGAAALGRVAAVRLFLDRVALGNARFALTEANATAVARLCVLLEGVPLAIELAASRMKVLSVSQILARLDNRLRVLADGGRAPDPRHGSLRATIGWSYDLLTDEEREVLRRLGVFAGGGTLDAVEAVTGGWPSVDRPGRRPPATTLDLLARLVEKSLLVGEEDDAEMRYRMLEAIREYATERLVDAGEEVGARDRHALWVLRIATEAKALFMGPDEIAALAALEREHDNIRAALRWSLDSGKHEIALGLCGALGRFWSVRSHLTEGRSWTLEALAAAADDAPELRAEAFYSLAQIAMRQGDFARVREALEAAQPLCDAVGDRRLSALVVRELGVVAIRQGDYDTAESLLEESLATFTEIGDDQGRSLALSALGLLAMDRGEFERAEAWTRKCLDQARALGNARGAAVGLYNLGVIAGRRQDPAAAKRYYEESCEEAERLGDSFFIAHVVQGLGSAALDLGDVALAEAHYERALRLDLELNDRDHGAWTLWGFADAAFRRGAMERSLRLVGAALALWDSVNASLPPAERSDFERKLAAAKEAVGDDMAERLLAEGRATTFADAGAFALRHERPRE